MRELAAILWFLVLVTFALAIPGGALLLGMAFAGFALGIAPIAVLAALGGTAYWVCHARRGPNWDRELVVLIALYAVVADVVIIAYAFHVACDGFRP